jgi:hypothetical protein
MRRLAAPRVASACLAAGLTMTMLGAFLLPGRGPSATAPGSGTAVVYAWAPGWAPAPTLARPGFAAAAPEGRPPMLPTPSRPSLPAGAAPPGPDTASDAAADEARVTLARPAPAGVSGSAAAESQPAAVAITGGPQTPAPARAASAPLRLDRSVVREASRISRSAVQQMAEAAGQTAGDAPVSASERLAESVARTVKPDCLPPGGSYGLLNLPVAAFLMATDTCRNR